MSKKIILFALLFVSFHKGVAPAKQLSEPLQRYNITTSDEEKFVWFRVAKTGTRSLLYLLENHFSFSVNGGSVTYDQGIAYNASNYQDYFKFTFVRNPWGRVVSCFCNKVLTKNYPRFKECFGKDFAYFVDFIKRNNVEKADVHIRLQSCLFPTNEVQFIGRFETFEEDVKNLFSLLGVEGVRVPHKNRSKHRHYSHFYTEETRKIIAEKYKRDIELFGYEYESK